MEPMLINFIFFNVAICMPMHWCGQHSLLQGEPTAQGSVTGAQPVLLPGQPGRCPWAPRGTASSCLLPTHVSRQEGLCWALAVPTAAVTH